MVVVCALALAIGTLARAVAPCQSLALPRCNVDDRGRPNGSTHTDLLETGATQSEIPSSRYDVVRVCVS